MLFMGSVGGFKGEIFNSKIKIGLSKQTSATQ